MRIELTTDNAASADYTDRSFETAAWWQEWKAQPGSYEVERHPKPDFYNPTYFVTVTVISGRGYFASLWGGVPISREPYDLDKHAGRAGSIRVRLTACQCITDERIVIDDEEYDAVLREAITEAEKDYEFRQKMLREKIARGSRYSAVDLPMIPDYEWRSAAEAATLLSSLNQCASDRAQRGGATARVKKAA